MSLNNEIKISRQWSSSEDLWLFNLSDIKKKIKKIWDILHVSCHVEREEEEEKRRGGWGWRDNSGTDSDTDRLFCIQQWTWYYY